MAEHKREHDWSIASNLMALIATVHRARKSQKFKPSDFNPCAKPSTPVKVGIGVLKDVFIDRKVTQGKE